MVKKSSLLSIGASVAALALSSCTNFVLPDSNHPDVLPVPMYKAKPIPRGASYLPHEYRVRDKVRAAEEGQVDHTHSADSYYRSHHGHHRHPGHRHAHYGKRVYKGPSWRH